MTSSSVQPRLAFGIEMELFIEPKQVMMSYLAHYGWDHTVTPATTNEDLTNKNRIALRETIAEILTNGGIYASTKVTEYEGWTIADETALDEVAGFWRIELVSKIMTTADRWQEQIDQVFEILEDNCSITLTTGCAIHIHVSPVLTSDNKYTAGQLVNIMKAIAYFDEPTTKIMQETQKNNEWAMSNVQGREAPKNLKDAYLMIPTTSWGPLFKIFETVKTLPMARMVLGSSRGTLWNFSNVDSECGTIGFRQPSGVKSAAVAKHWTSFTLGFIFQAMARNFHAIQSTNTYPTVSMLRQFVDIGIQQLEPTSYGAINRSMMVEDTSKPTMDTTAELEAIKLKKAEGENKGYIFVEKVSCA